MLPTNCLSVFEHFVALSLWLILCISNFTGKNLMTEKGKGPKIDCWKSTWEFYLLLENLLNSNYHRKKTKQMGP